MLLGYHSMCFVIMFVPNPVICTINLRFTRQLRGMGEHLFGCGYHLLKASAAFLHKPQ